MSYNYYRFVADRDPNTIGDGLIKFPRIYESGIFLLSSRIVFDVPTSHI